LILGPGFSSPGGNSGAGKRDARRSHKRLHAVRFQLADDDINQDFRFIRGPYAGAV
jgi:hypothetical protein